MHEVFDFAFVFTAPSSCHVDGVGDNDAATFEQSCPKRLLKKSRKVALAKRRPSLTE